jgi:nitrite reductase/ring-hydroxylating ferredoxin subunit
VESGDRAVLIAVTNGQPYAVSDECLHRQGRLSDGVLRDGVVTCPEHWWRYDIRTGARTDHPEDRPEVFDVRVVDGWIEVDVPAGAPARSLRDILLAHARGEDA